MVLGSQRHSSCWQGKNIRRLEKCFWITGCTRRTKGLFKRRASVIKRILCGKNCLLDKFWEFLGSWSASLTFHKPPITYLNNSKWNISIRILRTWAVETRENAVWLSASSVNQNRNTSTNVLQAWIRCPVDPWSKHYHFRKTVRLSLQPIPWTKLKQFAPKLSFWWRVKLRNGWPWNSWKTSTTPVTSSISSVTHSPSPTNWRINCQLTQQFLSTRMKIR